MLARTLLPAYAHLVGVLLGAKVDVSVTPPRVRAVSPLSALTLELDAVRVEYTGGDRAALLPVQSFSISGQRIRLGWKALALMLAPMWAFIPGHFFARPFLLLLLLMRAPGGPSSGVLECDAFVSERDLSRGRAWRWLLGGVLSGITRSSLPALLASASIAEGIATTGALPSSRCVGARVRGAKLELDGKIELALATDAADITTVVTDYTLRTGLVAQRLSLDGAGAALDAERSAFVWQDPELRLSLGEGRFTRLLPKIWMPVLSATAVTLPACVELRRVAISDAAGGATASGLIRLAPADAAADGPPAGALALR